MVVFPDEDTFLGTPGTIIDANKPPPSLVSIKYYDVDGFEVPGPIPTIAVEGT